MIHTRPPPGAWLADPNVIGSLNRLRCPNLAACPRSGRVPRIHPKEPIFGLCFFGTSHLASLATADLVLVQVEILEMAFRGAHEREPGESFNARGMKREDFAKEVT
jgi:hypothetical protein